MLPNKPQLTVEDVGSLMWKRQKKLKSGSAVIFVISGAVGNVRTCRVHLLLIIIFVKKCC